MKAGTGTREQRSKQTLGGASIEYGGFPSRETPRMERVAQLRKNSHELESKGWTAADKERCAEKASNTEMRRATRERETVRETAQRERQKPSETQGSDRAKERHRHTGNDTDTHGEVEGERKEDKETDDTHGKDTDTHGEVEEERKKDTETHNTEGEAGGTA